VRWLPVNVAAEALYGVVKHAASNATERLTFFNLENGVAAPWNAVVDAVRSASSPTKPMRVVPHSEWLDKVRKSPETPAFPVVDYFAEYMVSGTGRSLPVLSTLETRKVVGDIIDFHIDEDYIKNCVSYACASAASKDN
jgi:hypothetical protein